MRTLLPITLTTLLLAATAVSAQAQTDPTNPNVVAPDGVCTRIPNPADLNGPDIPDETDPDCHEAGLIYQQVPDTHIDAHVDTTGTDWATACRALGVTVGPLAAGTRRTGTPHVRERRPRTYAQSAEQPQGAPPTRYGSKKKNGDATAPSTIAGRQARTARPPATGTPTPGSPNRGEPCKPPNSRGGGPPTRERVPER